MRSLFPFLPGALLVVVALAHPFTAGAQDDDQGWSQFTRENTLRATVTGATPGAKGNGEFAVKTDGGQQWRVLYGPNTKFLRDRAPARAQDVQVGDMLFAAGNLDEKKKQIGAAILIDIDAAEVRKAKEGLGKTWVAGKVIAVNGVHITVQRLDGIEQVVAVDEGTSFRRKQEPVTLAEVHPGEGIRAEGRVVDGVFTATLLHVFDLNGHEPWLDAGPGQ